MSATGEAMAEPGAGAEGRVAARLRRDRNPVACMPTIAPEVEV